MTGDCSHHCPGYATRTCCTNCQKAVYKGQRASQLTLFRLYREAKKLQMPENNAAMDSKQLCCLNSRTCAHHQEQSLQLLVIEIEASGTDHQGHASVFCCIRHNICMQSTRPNVKGMKRNKLAKRMQLPYSTFHSRLARMFLHRPPLCGLRRNQWRQPGPCKAPRLLKVWKLESDVCAAIGACYGRCGA